MFNMQNQVYNGLYKEKDERTIHIFTDLREVQEIPQDINYMFINQQYLHISLT